MTKMTFTPDQVKAMVMPLHRIEVSIENEFGPEVKFACDAEPNSKCRLVCAEECGAEEWPCYTYLSEEEERVPHNLTDSDHCIVIVWLNEAEGPWDVYDQDSGKADVRPGLIQVRWEGETFVWSYPQPPAVALDAPVPHDENCALCSGPPTNEVMEADRG